MDINKYQKKALEAAVFGHDRAFEYLVMGLCSEAGEVAGKYKKVIRDKKGIVDIGDFNAIADELGDVLWYISVLAHHVGCSMDYIANKNLEKLQSRKERGVISGSGDKR